MPVVTFGNRRFAREHIIEHTAERIDVCSVVDVQALGLLRTHVSVGSDDLSNGLAGNARTQVFGDAEVNDTDTAVGAYHDVRGFDVAMDTTTFMHIFAKN